MLDMKCSIVFVCIFDFDSWMQLNVSWMCHFAFNASPLLTRESSVCLTGANQEAEKLTFRLMPGPCAVREGGIWSTRHGAYQSRVLFGGCFCHKDCWVAVARWNYCQQETEGSSYFHRIFPEVLGVAAKAEFSGQKQCLINPHYKTWQDHDVYCLIHNNAFFVQGWISSLNHWRCVLAWAKCPLMLLAEIDAGWLHANVTRWCQHL